MFDIVITEKETENGQKKICKNINRYASRGILLNDKNQIALMRIGVKDLYKLPGGGIENNETKTEAFIREIKEETGYDCNIIAEIGKITEHKYKNNFCQLSYCFIAKKCGDNPVQNLTEKEKKLGFSLVWKNITDAVKEMTCSVEKCLDYSDKFLMHRDKYIIEYFKNNFKGEVI
ncbi:MAG: NUDIX domain-containing protein [Oscillospiraceae bacterium]